MLFISLEITERKLEIFVRTANENYMLLNYVF